MAPEPFEPVASTPAKLSTLMEAETLFEREALTVTLVKTFGAKARHISESPFWVLVRTAITQVSPPPETLLTTVFVPDPGASVAINASTNSLPDAVENGSELSVVLGKFWLFDVFASIVNAAFAGPAIIRNRTSDVNRFIVSFSQALNSALLDGTNARAFAAQ